MKKIIVTIIILFIVFNGGLFGFLYLANHKKAIEQPKDDFLKVPEYKTEEPTTSISPTYSGNVSYWFVVSESKDGDRYINGFMKQDHSWFSYSEAKKEMDGGFIMSFIRVDKETYTHNSEE